MKIFHFFKKYGILRNNVYNKKFERGILMILSCQNICKTFVEKPVLQNISFHLNENDRLAIIGYNGAGKSTLLKILIGEISYDEGEISLKKDASIGYLAQHQDHTFHHTIFDELLSVKKEVIELDEQMRTYEQEMKHLTGDALEQKMNQYTNATHRFEQLNGFAYKSEITGILKGLGFSEEDFTKEINTLSGGQRTRVALGKLLLKNPDILLLDEPTNHLDVDSIRWLENYLSHYKGAVIIVSHDRYFLDEVVDKIWELKDGKITEYWGNYSDYLRQKEEERKNQVAEYEQFVTERARLERAAEEKRKQARKIEQKAKGASKKKSTERGGRLAHQKSMGSKEKKMHNAAKSLEHRIAALGNVEAPEDIRRIRFRQSKALELHNPYPIVGTDITKIFGDKVLFEDASFQIPLGAKVALTGGNGTGKTTLIQMILNYEDGISISPKAKIGYFAQNGYKYNSNQKVLEFMKEDCDYNVSEIRSVLASMGFKQNDIGKSLSILSGGEIMKLLLAKMLMGRYNILLMDEPSNFLDIPSLEALEILMKEYAGTIMFITHDKRLLENVADVIYEIKDKKLNLVR